MTAPTFTKTDPPASGVSFTPIDTAALKLVRGGGPPTPSLTLINNILGSTALTPIDVSSVTWRMGAAIDDDFTVLTSLPSSRYTHSRTSLATMVDSTGKITFAPNNLLVQSNSFGNAAWVKSGSGTGVAPVVTPFNATGPDGVANTASTVVFNSGAGTTASDSSALSISTGTQISGVNYVGSIKMKGVAGQKILIRQNGLSSYTAWTFTGGWDFVFSKEVGVGGAGNSFEIALRQGIIGTINSSVTVLIAYASLSAVTYETSPRPVDLIVTGASTYHGPRFSFDPVTLTCRGLRIEGSSTNAVVHSVNLGSNPQFDVSSVAGQVAPDGTTKAVTITATAGAVIYHYVGATTSGYIAGQVRTMSVYVKQGTAPYVGFGEGGDSIWHAAWMKWSDLTVGCNNGTVSAPEAVGGGWYRLRYTYTRINAGVGNVFIGPGTTASSSSGPLYAAAGTETVIAWGLQDEAGAFASSLIPTYGATASRSADVIQITGDAATLLAAPEGAIVASTTKLDYKASSNSVIISASAPRSMLYIPTSYTVGLAKVWSYNGLAVIESAGLANYTTNSKVGVSWAPSYRAVVSAGSAAGSDTAAMNNIAPFYLGSATAGGGDHLSGFLKRLQIYSYKLTAAQLQAATA